MTPLEQFNEEVIKEFSIIFPNKKENNKKYTTCNCFLKSELDDEGAWVGDRNDIKYFITKKLTEHKELILGMVRKKIFEDTNYDYKLWIESEKYRWHQGGRKELREEFLNNLDTI